MATKRNAISEILAEAKEAAKELDGQNLNIAAAIRIMLLCGLLGDIKIPVERKAEVLEAIGEIMVAASGIIDRKFFEQKIKKIRS